MSGRRTRDYRAVLHHLKMFIPDANVETFVLDFEAALWKSLANGKPQTTKTQYFYLYLQVFKNLFYKIMNNLIYLDYRNLVLTTAVS